MFQPVAAFSSPDAFEFFTEAVNLPAGRNTWSPYGYTGSDDAPGDPDFTQFGASPNAILELRFTPGFGRCNAADLADPRDLLDLADITALFSAFGAQLETGDLNASGVLDLADVVIFVTAFNAGRP